MPAVRCDATAAWRELTARPLDFDLRGVVADVMKLFTESAQAKGLTLHVEIGDTVPPLLRGDALRLRQTLINLVGNALKFTAAGGVTIAACAEGDFVRFTVRYSGRGIPVEAQALLFQKFTQLEAGTRAAEEGVGLGLSICRELVNLMGGTIELTSAGLGLGTEVRFTLPRTSAAGAAAPLL